jgi:hypothetical protein
MDPFSFIMQALLGGGASGAMGGGSPLTGGGPASIFDQMAAPFQPPQQPGQPLDIGSASGGAPNLTSQMPQSLQNWLNRPQQSQPQQQFPQSQIGNVPWMQSAWRPPQFRPQG